MTIEELIKHYQSLLDEASRLADMYINSYRAAYENGDKVMANNYDTSHRIWLAKRSVYSMVLRDLEMTK